jgi:hypothetical protein
MRTLWWSPIFPVFLTIAIGSGVSSCIRVPDADQIASPPSIEQIVARVKCDLESAVSPYLLDRDMRYEWFKSWTAQANLNFIVNDQIGLTPGATFTQPLTTASISLRVTNAARSWNLGVGAGLTTTASRNETVTFSMSLRDLSDELVARRSSFGCGIGTVGLDLHSDLMLDQWIADALTRIIRQA